MPEIKDLKEKLFYEKENGNTKLPSNLLEKVYSYCEEYKTFLNNCKTEREACSYSVNLAKKRGFEEFVKGKKYEPGDKIYYVNRNKSVVLVVFGERPIEEGIGFAVAHIDSPRLDLKPNPVYEDDEIAYFKTHYYGGIKKYQWTTIPLALHGVIFKENGDKIEIVVGEDEKDVAFCISDLLPHLGQDQLKKHASEVIEGEQLNIIVGSRPLKKDKEGELVKLNLLKILNEKYGIVEKDFVSAELEIVPAFKARDIGFDGAFIGSYGQDDRVCGYNSLRAILDIEGTPKRTAVTMLVDKEEIGSLGNTGMDSNFFEYFIGDLGEPYGVQARTILSNSECLSADVGSCYDPNFKEVFETRNAAHAGYGTIVEKYTGRAGKAYASDATSEFTNKIIRLLDEKGIVWQASELGKIDIGGGGTVSMFVAKMNIDVIDIGVPLLSMHSPFELSSKVDVFENYRAIHEFLKYQ